MRPVRRCREFKTLSISQGAYKDAIVGRFHLKDVGFPATPLYPNVQLTMEMRLKIEEAMKRMKLVPYSEAVGSLMYAWARART